MNEPNPYSPPQAVMPAVVVAPGMLNELDFKRLKKLYYRSCNVNVITNLKKK